MPIQQDDQEEISPEERDRLSRAAEHLRARREEADKLAARMIFEEWMGIEPEWLREPSVDPERPKR